MLKIAKNLQKRKLDNLEVEILKPENTSETIEDYIIKTNLQTELMSNPKLTYNNRFSLYDNLLHAAVSENKLVIVNWLLKKGVNIIAEDAKQNNSLYIAIKKSNYEITKLLLEHKVIEEFLDKSSSIVNRLLSYVIPSYVYHQKNHPENLAKIAVENNEPRILVLLLGKYNFSQAILSEYLFIAAGKGFLEITKLLIAIENVDVNYEKNELPPFEDGSGFIATIYPTPLLQAIRYNHPKIVEQLLLAKVTTTFTKLRYTAIHFAAELGYNEILQILIKYETNDISAEFDVQNPQYKTVFDAIFLAVGRQEHETVKLLIANGAKYNRSYNLGKIVTLLEYAETINKNSKSYHYIKNASKIIRDAVKLKAEELKLQEKRQSAIEPKMLAKSDNKEKRFSEFTKFEVNVITQSSRAKFSRKKNNVTIPSIEVSESSSKATSKKHEFKPTIIKTRADKKIVQPVAIDISIKEKAKADAIAQTHADRLALQKELDLAEQQKISQDQILAHYKLDKNLLDQVREKLIQKISSIIFKVWRNNELDHEGGRPAILIAKIDDKALLLLSTTKEYGKIRAHLGIKLIPKGPKSYFSEVVILPTSDIRGEWKNTKSQLNDMDKKVVSNLVGVGHLKFVFPNCFLNDTNCTNLQEQITVSSDDNDLTLVISEENFSNDNHEKKSDNSYQTLNPNNDFNNDEENETSIIINQ